MASLCADGHTGYHGPVVVVVAASDLTRKFEYDGASFTPYDAARDAVLKVRGRDDLLVVVTNADRHWAWRFRMELVRG